MLGHHPISNPWWRHQMETFSALLALCAGNSPVTGEFHAQRPVTRSFDVLFDLRLNKRFSHEAGDLKGHRAQHNVTVMPSHTADPSPLSQHPSIHNVTKTHLWSLLSVLNNAFTRIPGLCLNIKRSFQAWDTHYKDKTVRRSDRLVFIMRIYILVR